MVFSENLCGSSGRAHMKVREQLTYRHKIETEVVPSERKKKIDLEEVVKMVASIHASL